jgi:hypothetical protein
MGVIHQHREGRGGNKSTITRKVVYRPSQKGDDENGQIKENGTSSNGGSTNHPLGWTNPKSSHPEYAKKNGVASCVNCHSIDPASKGQKMSCYNCHGQKWATPATTGSGSTGGSTVTSDWQGWTTFVTLCPGRSHGLPAR